MAKMREKLKKRGFAFICPADHQEVDLLEETGPLS